MITDNYLSFKWVSFRQKLFLVSNCKIVQLETKSKGQHKRTENSILESNEGHKIWAFREINNFWYKKVMNERL